ncbi:polygalacturonase-like [Andrographis paniculata]|uniref:polygalacturonase-like n=1 Tax=Andrographis paniculata TaxID=175694 RepID=UPI0021E8587A|nr:polygalacturonase-like [Andrographis paniculata]
MLLKNEKLKIQSECQLAAMGFIAHVLVLSIALVASGIAARWTTLQDYTSGESTFDVTEYGAVGDEVTDDVKGFESAWKAACQAESDNVTIIVPSKTFLVSPISFEGPCQSQAITFQILGKIVAPPNEEWKNKSKDVWLKFEKVDGLIVSGNGKGTIDGRGESWWEKALRFQSCVNLRVEGLKHLNSPRNHVSIKGCQNGKFSGLHMMAPEDSPNTDGIDITDSVGINVHNNTMETGDDCIALSSGSSNINISNIQCGPGHGISIGSLGKGEQSEEVHDVMVNHCIFHKSTNGVRIKTWGGGSGSARNIVFSNIVFDQAKNPIIIDQHYCPHAQCPPTESNVKIFNVTYSGLRGTTLSDYAIDFNCSSTAPCKDIVLENVEIISVGGEDPGEVYCKHADEFILNVLVLSIALVGSGAAAWRTTLQEYVSEESTFDVTKFGAVGDGVKDDVKGFESAWAAACQAGSDNVTVIVPSYTFLVSPISFGGPCKSKTVVFHIMGKIVAPPKEAWNDTSIRVWLEFEQVDGLVVSGNGKGTIDGRGETWWQKGCPDGSRPTALQFLSCVNFQVEGLNHVNSPRNHVSIDDCQKGELLGLHMTAPEDSPNTDGIDISYSVGIYIHNNTMETGDDCIALNSGSSNINISDIQCSPGHGISIGSLEKNGQTEEVHEVTVNHCTFHRSENGVRIKTWEGGFGSARNIVFSNIEFDQVKNPIIMEQHYCPNEQCPSIESNVKVMNVTYSGLRGTTVSNYATDFNCSSTAPCKDIVLENVEIKSAGRELARAQVYCNHASSLNAAAQVVTSMAHLELHPSDQPGMSLITTQFNDTNCLLWSRG